MMKGSGFAMLKQYSTDELKVGMRVKYEELDAV